MPNVDAKYVLRLWPLFYECADTFRVSRANDADGVVAV